MGDFQDEEQWLYGDDKEDSNTREIEKEITASEKEPTQNLDEETEEEETSREKDKDDEEEPITERAEAETNGDVAEPEQNQEAPEAEQNGEKPNEDADEEDSFSSSSDEDELTVTIGKIVTQPDIMRPPPPTHRAAPTSGLKDDDFTSTGKVNGVPAQDFSLAELEDKPWRKPGADQSDYFNYGFTEESWIKYCERQKRMRNSESGVGLSGLGINIGKGLSGNIPVSIVNENSKYGGLRKVAAGIPNVKLNDDGGQGGGHPSSGNTIQVMTADRRMYSNKVLGGGGPNYDDMDFGGNPYGAPADFFSAPPPGYYPPPPPPAGPWGGIPPPNLPPPGWAPPDSMGIPPPMPPPHLNVGPPYFDDDSMGPMGSSHSRSSKDDRERDRDRDRDRDYDKIRESRDKESRERESRHHSSRRRSRSRSKSRHRKRSKTRSRSRSPSSHRHKRKKSKRERED